MIGCDHNNIDYTCMYGNAGNKPCQVNCYNCEKKCKRTSGIFACRKFVNINKNKKGNKK